MNYCVAGLVDALADPRAYLSQAEKRAKQMSDMGIDEKDISEVPTAAKKKVSFYASILLQIQSVTGFLEIFVSIFAFVEIQMVQTGIAKLPLLLLRCYWYFAAVITAIIC